MLRMRGPHRMRARRRYCRHASGTGWSAMSLGAAPDDGEVYIDGMGMRDGSCALAAESRSPGLATGPLAAAWSGLAWRNSPPSRACSRSCCATRTAAPYGQN